MKDSIRVSDYFNQPDMGYEDFIDSIKRERARASAIKSISFNEPKFKDFIRAGDLDAFKENKSAYEAGIEAVEYIDMATSIENRAEMDMATFSTKINTAVAVAKNLGVEGFDELAFGVEDFVDTMKSVAQKFVAVIRSIVRAIANWMKSVAAWTQSQVAKLETNLGDYTTEDFVNKAAAVSVYLPFAPEGYTVDLLKPLQDLNGSITVVAKSIAAQSTTMEQVVTSQSGEINQTMADQRSAAAKNFATTAKNTYKDNRANKGKTTGNNLVANADTNAAGASETGIGSVSSNLLTSNPEANTTFTALNGRKLQLRKGASGKIMARLMYFGNAKPQKVKMTAFAYIEKYFKTTWNTILSEDFLTNSRKYFITGKTLISILNDEIKKVDVVLKMLSISKESGNDKAAKANNKLARGVNKEVVKARRELAKLRNEIRIVNIYSSCLMSSYNFALKFRSTIASCIKVLVNSKGADADEDSKRGIQYQAQKDYSEATSGQATAQETAAAASQQPPTQPPVSPKNTKSGKKNKKRR